MIEKLETRYEKQFSFVFQSIKSLINPKNEPVNPIDKMIPRKE